MPALTTQLVRRRLAVIAAAAVAVALLAGASRAAAQARSSAGSPGAAGAVPGGTWGTAIEVPGTAALHQGGYAFVSSVSCARAGNCSAGGSYADSHISGQTVRRPWCLGCLVDLDRGSRDVIPFDPAARTCPHRRAPRCGTARPSHRTDPNPQHRRSP
jgi:hypothetical protein